VFPEQMDIRAHSSATFRVAFRPPLDGQYFSQTIEVVACFKAHRSFRGVSHNAVLPPWTMSVQVSRTDTLMPIHMHTVHFFRTLSTLYSRQKSVHVQLAACAILHSFIDRKPSLHNRQKCICMQTGSTAPLH